MTTVAFNLRVPADTRFAALAPDVAARFMDMMGGAPSDCTALAAALTGAMHELKPDPHGDVELAFSAEPTGLQVTLRSGSRTSVVRHPLPAAKG
jgi:hypothetical protein